MTIMSSFMKSEIANWLLADGMRLTIGGLFNRAK